MKLSVSEQCFNELSVVLKRAGRELNDGAPLSIEKGDAIMPPHDFRMVAVRQNCLMAAAQAYVAPLSVENLPKQDTDKFLNFCDEIFNWCLNGKNIDRNPDKTKGVWR